MFKVMIELQECGEFTDFASAFRHFYEKTLAILKVGVSEQLLFSTNWITMTEFDTSLYFQEVVDIAEEVGLLKDGKLVENPGQIDNDKVLRAFDKMKDHFRGVLHLARSVVRTGRYTDHGGVD